MAKETRTYRITGEARILNQLEDALAIAQHLGDIGASRYIKFGVDGDGQARIRVEKDGEKIKCLRPFDTNKEVIHVGLC